MQKVKTHKWSKITAPQLEKYLAERITFNGERIAPAEMKALISFISQAIVDLLMSEAEVTIRDFGTMCLFSIPPKKTGERYRMILFPNVEVEEAIEAKKRMLPLTDNILDECMTEGQKIAREIQRRKAAAKQAAAEAERKMAESESEEE